VPFPIPLPLGRPYSTSNMIRRILILLGYFAAFLVIAGLTAVLVAYGKGYSYDFKGHKIVHNGLLLLSSQPSGADITIKGKETQHHTPRRVTLQAGSYAVSVVKDGYRGWQKTVSIVASEVTFAEYILLVPNQLHPQKIATLSAPPVAASSRDYKRLAYTQPNGTLLAGASDGQFKPIWHAPSTPTAPTSSTPAANQITALVWADDSSRLLATVQNGDQKSFWVVNADGSGATNLTELYKFDFSTGLVFTPGNAGKLYWNSPDGLRQLDVGAQTVSGVLADQVLQIVPALDRLFYVQQNQLGRTLMSLDRSGHKQQAVQVLPVSQSYSVAYESVGGHDYLAVVPSQTHTATLYVNPFSSRPTAVVITAAADRVLFSPLGTYLLAEGTDSAVYDISRANLTNKPVIYGLPGLVSPTDISWYDDNHLIYRGGDQVWLTEFDGGNTTQLISGAQTAAWPLPSAHGFNIAVASGASSQFERVIIRP
jgi:hypothetical protein